MKTLQHKDKNEMKDIFKQQWVYQEEVLNSRLDEIIKRRKQRMIYLQRQAFERLPLKHMKKLTILHSNDLHGDFLAEEVDKGLIGGVSMLSGYVSKVRNEEQNVIYAIAGDMFRGSVIDSEYQG